MLMRFERPAPVGARGALTLARSCAARKTVHYRNSLCRRKLPFALRHTYTHAHREGHPPHYQQNEMAMVMTKRAAAGRRGDGARAIRRKK